MNKIITKDYSEFGHREKEMARDLLQAYGTNDDKTEYLGQGVEVYFNLHSGYVFLSDEDYNVAIMNGSTLEDFIHCPDCGGEGVASEFAEDNTDECCQEYANDMGLTA